MYIDCLMTDNTFTAVLGVNLFPKTPPHPHSVDESRASAPSASTHPPIHPSSMFFVFAAILAVFLQRTDLSRSRIYLYHDHHVSYVRACVKTIRPPAPATQPTEFRIPPKCIHTAKYVIYIQQQQQDNDSSEGERTAGCT